MAFAGRREIGRDLRLACFLFLAMTARLTGPSVKRRREGTRAVVDAYYCQILLPLRSPSSTFAVTENSRLVRGGYK
ncbi:hypothetical protein B0H10DRAFT_2059552 [Mycena sp. CBHHK59/15]|nr:hypothetical protein B0H10DRAFT_2059552 [Mycena sp. CBHHK59/15]